MKVWITSDTHFGHANIIQYCNRPFLNPDQMDETIIERWNECVADDDVVFFLGDFALCHQKSKENITALAHALKGHKIIIKGNHDSTKIRYSECGFDAEFYQEWAINGINMRHRPDNIENDADKWDIIFFGHVHNTPFSAPVNCYNVCQDVHDFRPVDITNYFTSDELISIQKLIKMD